MTTSYKVTIYSIIALLIISSISFADTVSDSVMINIENIKNIQFSKDQNVLDNNSKVLDQAWKYFSENKEIAMPIIAEQLKQELAKDVVNDFMLLDLGFYLRISNDSSEYNDISRAALYRLDPEDELVKLVSSQYFTYVHELAKDQDEGILDYIDKNFLFKPFETTIPQHSLKLDQVFCCVFLYGVYGADSEDHLLQYLDKEEHLELIFKILAFLGTDKSVERIYNIATPELDDETFMSAVFYLMSNGGKKGTDLITTFNKDKFKTRSQGLLEKIQEPLKTLTFDMIIQGYQAYGGDKELDDNELLNRMQTMYDNYGKLYDTSPMAFFNSKLPKEQLIHELNKIKYRYFYRISDETIGEVKVTIGIINALSYRDY